MYPTDRTGQLPLDPLEVRRIQVRSGSLHAPGATCDHEWRGLAKHDPRRRPYAGQAMFEVARDLARRPIARQEQKQVYSSRVVRIDAHQPITLRILDDLLRRLRAGCNLGLAVGVEPDETPVCRAVELGVEFEVVAGAQRAQRKLILVMPVGQSQLLNVVVVAVAATTKRTACCTTTSGRATTSGGLEVDIRYQTPAAARIASPSSGNEDLAASQPR